MNAPDAASEGGRSENLRRYGPPAAILVVVAVVSALLFWPSNDNASESSSGAGGTVTTLTPDGSTPIDTSAPLFFSEAQDMEIVDTIDWGERCDTTLGTYAYPSPYAMPCVADFEGDNGGATAKGVTADSVKVVVYRAQDDDPVIEFIAGAVENNDTNAQQQRTIEKDSELFAHFAELYGRSINYEFYTATGLANDEIAARADAAAIAEMNPFAVWGSPAFAGKPYAEELAAQEVLCFCTGGGTVDFVAEHDPYLVSLFPSTQQGRLHLVEFIGKRLGDRRAIYSGEFVDKDRRIALVYLETSDFSTEVAGELNKQLKTRYGIELVDMVPYSIDPATQQEQSATIIARLKSAGVTTVAFAGDPVAPISLTQEATAQRYFPEWVVTGTGYTENTAFGRLYDQQQWQHAFGITWAGAPVNLDKAGPYSRYVWYHGEEPEARDSINDLEATISFIYYWVQQTGPNLSPRTFIDTLFNTPITETDPLTSVRLSWGNKGIWPADLEPDYQGIDDQSEIWWDPTATGVDEIGREGTGMWRWVDGGERYYPGERPDGPAPFFEVEGSVAMYDDLPPGDELPDYPRP